MKRKEIKWKQKRKRKKKKNYAKEIWCVLADSLHAVGNKISIINTNGPMLMNINKLRRDEFKWKTNLYIYWNMIIAWCIPFDRIRGEGHRKLNRNQNEITRLKIHSVTHSTDIAALLEKKKKTKKKKRQIISFAENEQNKTTANRLNWYIKSVNSRQKNSFRQEWSAHALTKNVHTSNNSIHWSRESFASNPKPINCFQ